MYIKCISLQNINNVISELKLNIFEPYYTRGWILPRRKKIHSSWQSRRITRARSLD